MNHSFEIDLSGEPLNFSLLAKDVGSVTMNGPVHFDAVRLVETKGKQRP